MTKLTPIVALLLAASAVTAGVQPVIIRATLLGQGKGKAVYKTKDTATEHQAELSVSAENLRPNTAYRLTIGTLPAVPVITDGFGTFRLSARYTTLARPGISVGDQVRVINSSAQIVLGGTFN